MKRVVTILTVLILASIAELRAQSTFRVGGEILNADTFEVRVYAHPIGLIYSQRCADKVWSVLLGESDNYIIEFETDRRLKVADLIGFKGVTHDLKLDVNFTNATDVTIVHTSDNKKLEIIYRGKQSIFMKF